MCVTAGHSSESITHRHAKMHANTKLTPLPLQYSSEPTDHSELFHVYTNAKLRSAIQKTDKHIMPQDECFFKPTHLCVVSCLVEVATSTNSAAQAPHIFNYLKLKLSVFILPKLQPTQTPQLKLHTFWWSTCMRGNAQFPTFCSGQSRRL